MKRCKQLLLLASSLVSIGLAQAQSNTPPVAFSQSLTATQGSSIFITLTASDPDGDSLTYRIVSPPSLGYGYLTGAPPNVLYISTTNFSTEVTDSFMFVANDGLADSSAATISITLYPPSESSNTLPVLSLVSNDAVASEALNVDGTTNTATFSIQRTGNLTNDVSVSFSVHGSATYGSDYYTVPALLGLFSNSTTTVFLPAGAPSIVYTLYPIPDNLTEGTEFAIFTINTNSSYALGLPSQITVSILDSNPPPVPSTRVILPPDGAVYASSLDIKLRVANSNVANLKLYADNQLLASFTSAPTIVTFVTNFSVGSHTIYSVQDNFPAGGNVTSAPVHFQVLAPLASNPLSPSLETAPQANASFVIDSNGALFDFGDGRLGALADGSGPNQEPNNVTRPIQIPLPAGTNRFVKFSSGSHHTLALTAGGSLWTCGDNSSGQTGQGKSTATFSGFVTIPEFPGWKDISAGNDHSLALDKSGRLTVCGNNSSGQLGLGNTTNVSTFQFVPFPTNVTTWTAIAAGSNYSIALGNNGQLYACGLGLWGTLGTGGLTNSLRFVPVALPTGVTNWLRVTAGAQHVLAIAGNGALYAWGLGSLGQLGNGSFSISPLPHLVTPPAGVSNWLALAAGISHSLGIGNDGNLYGWGNSALGQLGPGPVASPLPTLIPAPSGVVSWKTISSGINHSLGLGDNCTLYAWGANNFGQLGIGSLVNQTNETPVQNLNTLCAAFTNQPPVAFSQFLVATQHTIVPITLTASDPDNDPLTYQIIMPPSLGFLTGAPPNVLYISTTNFLTTVTDRFTFVANDGHTDSFPATVTLLLLPPSQSSNALPVVTITSTDALASEQLNPDGTTNTANFAISRAGTTNGPLDVLLEVIGTAHYDVDYYALPPLNVSSNSNVATVSIPAGSSSVPFTLYGSGRVLPNPPVTAVFTIATGSGYTLGSPNQASISIINSNRPPIAPTRIFFPPDGSVFASPLNIELRVASTNVSTVKLYADGNLIGSTSAPPGSAIFVFNVVTNFPAGAHTAYTIANNSLTSAPVHFFVSATNISSVHAPLLGVMPVANSSFVVDANGALFGWGSDGFANLGDGGLTSNSLFSAGVTLPIQIPLPASGAAWTKVDSGGQHTLALDSLGNLYATGDNTYGQIGVGSRSTMFTNVLLSAARIVRSKDVAAGNFHSLALTTDGQIYAWGYNDFGQLGNGTTTNAPFPRPVSFPPGVTNWTAVAAGVYHSLALGNDGNAYAWGYAEFGALGNGANTNASIPQRVVLPAGVTNWLKIAAGGYHNLALGGNGKLYSWGYGGVGTLGYGGVTNANIPVPVRVPINVVNWAAISAGILHSLALAQDGSIYGWGDNIRGQLGPNAGTLQPVPFLIAPPSGVQSWQQISAGAFHSLAIADSCMAYSWGSNSLGQLGVGSFAQQFSLQKVHNLDDLCIGIVTETNRAPSFVKGPDITVPENAGIQVFTNWATQINPGAPSETNQTLTFIVTNDNPHLFSTQPGIVPSGNLFFAGAPDSNGVAYVTVVLKDNGGTANGGQDASAPQSFIITITPPNHPPVPVVRVFPLFVLSSNYSVFQVISPNNSNALVFFDASLSTDVDGDPLAFAWFKGGTNNLFGTSVVASNVLGIGTNSIILTVNDRHIAVIDPFEVQVLSAGDALEEFIALIQDFAAHSAIKPNVWKQLIDSLQTAQSEFENGQWNAGLVHLRIFQFRVLLQIAPSDRALAKNLNYIAQQIVDAVQGSAKHQTSIGSIENRGGSHKSLTFAGAPGQIYLVQASGDLLRWETIGIASETDPGVFQFDDRDNAAARFYRLILP